MQVFLSVRKSVEQNYSNNIPKKHFLFLFLRPPLFVSYINTQNTVQFLVEYFSWLCRNKSDVICCCAGIFIVVVPQNC